MHGKKFRKLKFQYLYIFSKCSVIQICIKITVFNLINVIKNLCQIFKNIFVARTLRAKISKQIVIKKQQT